MLKWVVAGAVYFAIVFVAAFVLGILRVTFVAPALGDITATLLELPLMLAFSWVCCAWVIRFLDAASLGRAIAMGATAFALLMGAEAVGSSFIYNRSLADHVASYATIAAASGLAGQIAFGLFPVAQYLHRQLRDENRATGSR
jgi:hypothetical protein